MTKPLATDAVLKFAKELAFPLEAVTQKFGVIGQSGGGKTYDALKLAELMLSHDAQIIWVDIPGSADGLRSSADGKKAGFKVVQIGGATGELPINASAGKLYADLVVDHALSVILNVSEMVEDDQLLFLCDFFSRFFDRKRSNRTPVHVFIDEAQEVIPETPTSKLQAKLRGIMVRLMKIGRNFGIGWTAITQEPQAASKRALNQAGTLIVVRTIGEHERKAIGGWARSRTKTKEQLALMDILPELEQGQALVWSPGWLRYAGVVHVLKRVTFDSSKTPEVGEKAPKAKVMAELDVGQLKKDVAALIEKAQADDPRLLKQKIVALEKELTAKKITTAREYPIDAVKPAAKAKTKVVQEKVVLAQDLKSARALIGKMETWQSKMAAVVKGFGDAIGPVFHDMQKRLHVIEAKVSEARSTDKPTSRIVEDEEAPRAAPMARAVALERPQQLARVLPKAPTKPPPAPVDAGDVKIGKGERIVLKAIAQHAEGATREQVTVLTGYKRSSRDTYLQKLKAAGFVVDGAGNLLLATETGIAELGPDFEALPTGDALREHWLAKLPSGERRVLEVVVSHYPNNVSRDAIDEATGYKRSSRDTYLQKLGARRLVNAERAGITASATLFG